jgi:hypothetical protein
VDCNDLAMAGLLVTGCSEQCHVQIELGNIFGSWADVSYSIETPQHNNNTVTQ